MTTIDNKRTIMGALAAFLRWEREGKPKCREKQYYYDDYHERVERVGQDRYSFSIQVYDGPDGDTWWTGEFVTLNEGTDIEVTKESWYRR